MSAKAIYLSDPSNGIEIYTDRPHEQWKFHEDGTVDMATLRKLDLQALYEPQDTWKVWSSGTAIGSPASAGRRRIRRRTLSTATCWGMKLMAARYNGASFLRPATTISPSPRQHLEQPRAGARDQDMTGLSDYTLRFNDRMALDKARQTRRAGNQDRKRDGGVSLRDPGA